MVNAKGEGKYFKLAECAMRERVSAPAHLHARGKTPGATSEKQTREFRQKRREVFLRSRGESKESPQLFSRNSSISFFNPFSFNKIMLIRKKAFIFALDKTHPSLLLAALRCLYSAKGRAPPMPQRKRSLTY